MKKLINLIERARLRVIDNHFKKMVSIRKGKRFMLRYGDDIYEVKLIKKQPDEKTEKKQTEYWRKVAQEEFELKGKCLELLKLTQPKKK